MSAYLDILLVEDSLVALPLVAQPLVEGRGVIASLGPRREHKPMRIERGSASLVAQQTKPPIGQGRSGSSDNSHFQEALR